MKSILLKFGAVLSAVSVVVVPYFALAQTTIPIMPVSTGETIQIETATSEPVTITVEPATSTVATSTGTNISPVSYGDVNVMLHLCPSSITNLSDFNALGGFTEKEIACPVSVMTGDTSSGGIGANPTDFAFDVSYVGPSNTTMTNENLSGQPSVSPFILSSPTSFVPQKICETDVNADLNGDGIISAGICLDTSYYSWPNIPLGQIVVRETKVPAGYVYGTVEFTPSTMGGDNEISTLVSSNPDGTITLDTTRSDTGNVMLHVFNFPVATTSVAVPPVSAATTTTTTTTIETTPAMPVMMPANTASTTEAKIELMKNIVATMQQAIKLMNQMIEKASTTNMMTGEATTTM